MLGGPSARAVALAVLLLGTLAVLPGQAEARHACNGEELAPPAGVFVEQFGGFFAPERYQVDLEVGQVLTAALVMARPGELPSPGEAIDLLLGDPEPGELVAWAGEALLDARPEPDIRAHLEVHNSQGCHNFYEYGRTVVFTAPEDGTYILEVHGDLPGSYYALSYLIGSA